MASDDWKGSVEDELRRMALAGASDEALQSFIEARRSGDAGLADRLLSQYQMAQTPSPCLTAVQRLRVAALRPVVNSLDAHTLYAFVGIIWPLTDHASRSDVEPSCWESTAFVDELAHRLMHTALEQLQPSVVGRNGQLLRH